jgi:hypothetical protein
VTQNTVYIAAALAHLTEIGEPVPDDVARRIAPNGHEHVNFLGRYDFTAHTSPVAGQLGPLRHRNRRELSICQPHP